MNLALGIDTGGTYTDAVLVDHDTGRVLASAKALTTRHDLALGIGAAIAAVFGGDNVIARSVVCDEAISPDAKDCFGPNDGPRNDAPGGILRTTDVTLVGLSTTLATNTLAEGHRGAVCLLLIGYDRELMREYKFDTQLATDDVIYLVGGHDGLGNEMAPLDEDALRSAILARRDTVEAFAVSGYFAVRNPSHELRARDLIAELTGRPVTCGHELTSKLNAVRRATTAALNAHLVAPLTELISSVERTLAEWGIAAPLMVVKGDGSLVRAEWATRRPVETILSGPAASVVGAWHLAGRRDVWVVDVGGTTTDIGALHEGWPILNEEGATVGGWRTMVEAVDVHTAGLGGDSHVRLDDEGRLTIGPRRVVPLCLLASEHPAVAAELREQAAIPPKKRVAAAVEYITTGRRPASRLSEADQEALAYLAGRPRSVFALTQEGRSGMLRRRRIEELEAWGLARRAGFTPTDALHVLGRFVRWDADASRSAAAVLATQAGLPVEAFCERVVHAMSGRVATELVSKVLEDAAIPPGWEQNGAVRFMVGQALDGTPHVSENGRGGELDCTLTLRRPLVAIGAPVAAYLPETAARLHTELVIPPHAEVANAVGAVAGGIIQRQAALISPLDDQSGVRLHLPDGVHDFAILDDAVQYAEEIMRPRVESLAAEAGAEQVVTQMTRRDQIAPVVGGEVYLGTELTFVATGRPRVARRGA